MKINMPIKSFNDIEEFLHTIISRLPALPPQIRGLLVEALPLITSGIGSILISAALVPLLPGFSEFDPFNQSNLYICNIILLRIAAVIFGLVLLTSFTQLSQKKLRGWYSLFYLSILQIFFVILLFNIISLLSLILSWYVLFNIKKNYS